MAAAPSTSSPNRCGWATCADRHAWTTEDVAYACDLGLVAQEADGTPRIANPIYAEVVPRHLNCAVQTGLPQRMAWYVGADGGLDVEGLIAAFQAFFREHSEHWVQRFERYHEAGPQLLLQAHLQRIVNGGGRIEREYALGRGRTDLHASVTLGRATGHQGPLRNAGPPRQESDSTAPQQAVLRGREAAVTAYYDCLPPKDF